MSRPTARRVVVDGVGAAAAAAASAALVVGVLELWHANLGVPFAYSSDATYNLMLVKGVLEHGSWYVNHDLGAPFGQQLYDFAVGGDDLDLILMRALGFASRSPAVVVNLFYLLSFPLTAVTAYVVLRWARLRPLVAWACAVLFALAPYPFLRGETHLFLAADFGVPLAAYLILGTWSGAPMFTKRAGAPRWHSYFTGRSAATVLACAGAASAGQVYYAGFTLILVLVAVIGRLVARTSARSVVSGLAIAGLVAAFTAANLAPSFLYDLEHGRNYVAAARQPAESDVGGLKLAELVLPVPGHRLAPFAHLTRWYDWSVTPPQLSRQEQPSLGGAATIGFVWLLLVLVAAPLAPRAKFPETVARSQPAALAAASCFILGTVGGGSALIAYLVTPQLRAWNRISIFIAFFAILGVGMLLEGVRRAAGLSPLRRAAFAVAVVCFVGLGVLDQTTPSDIQPYRSTALQYASDSAFTRRIEAHLPSGSLVFELPYVPYPEGCGPPPMGCYDLARPYIHSEHLRWSYAAMKGRPEDWEKYIVEKPLQEVVAGAAAAGFAGVYLDGAGYRAAAHVIEKRIGNLIGARPLVGRAGRYVFWDLRTYAARLRARYGSRDIAALREDTLTPPRADPMAGFAPGEEITATGHRRLWVLSHRAELDLYEPARPQRVTFFATFIHARARGTGNAPAEVALNWPDRTQERLRATVNGTEVTKVLFLRHGHNVVRIQTNARAIDAPWDPRTLYLDVHDARFEEQAFVPFERAP